MTSGRIITEIKYLEVRDVPGDTVVVLTDPAFAPFEVPAGGIQEVPAYAKTEAVSIPESGVAAIRSVREEWPRLFSMEGELRVLKGQYEDCWLERGRLRAKLIKVENIYNNYRAVKDELDEIKGQGLWERLKWALKPMRSKRCSRGR